MLSRIPMVRLFVVVGVLALAALVAVATPILGGGQRLPGTLQSLSDLKKVQLHVEQLPRPLKRSGITEKQIREVWHERLKAAGIKVDTGRNIPVIHVIINYYADSEMPGVTAILGTVAFKQKVHVKRINMDLMVPTFWSTAHMLVSREDVGVAFGEVTDSMAIDFIASVHRATDFSASQDKS